MSRFQRMCNVCPKRPPSISRCAFATVRWIRQPAVPQACSTGQKRGTITMRYPKRILNAGPRDASPSMADRRALMAIASRVSASAVQREPCWQPPAGCHDQFDGRPTVTDGAGEPKTVHGTLNVDVRKHHPDVTAALQDPDRFVSIRCFDGFEARFLNPIDSARPDESMVLDNENHWPLCCEMRRL
jgi:hypothetical protein